MLHPTAGARTEDAAGTAIATVTGSTAASRAPRAATGSTAGALALAAGRGTRNQGAADPGERQRGARLAPTRVPLRSSLEILFVRVSGGGSGTVQAVVSISYHSAVITPYAARLPSPGATPGAAGAATRAALRPGGGAKQASISCPPAECPCPPRLVSALCRPQLALGLSLA